MDIIKTDVAIIGGGPAGYSAAFRCSDLNFNVIIVEKQKNIGGVCLNMGCIPSKALLYISKIIHQTEEMNNNGLNFNKPIIDIKKIKLWKENIIKKISHGLHNLAKKRNIKIIHNYGIFKDKNTIEIENEKKYIKFKYAIIATGSKPIKLKTITKKDNRIWNSNDALSLNYIPKKMLIIGGGIIGLEMSNIFNSLGSIIDILEMSKQIIPVIDEDIAKKYYEQMKNKINFLLNSKIKNININKNNIEVNIKQNEITKKYIYDTILIAIGREPNTNKINIEKLGIKINNKFICINKQMQTNISNIYAIGDVIGQPMLAHKGIYEGRMVAEIISGKKKYFKPKIIPYISYTNPEIAWVGVTEKEAIKRNIPYSTAIFPWSASGRAIISNSHQGITKLIFNKITNKIIGGILLGTSSGELLGEISLAIEMNCSAKDIALTIHAHPTLYESIGITAEIYDGTVTDLYNKN